jgi:precorrin-6B methylase 2
MWLLYLSVFVYFFLLWLVYTRLFGAEYFPTSPKVARAAIKLLRLKKKDIFYELGCGGGGIVFLAEKIGKCKAIGIEIDPIRVLYSKIKKFLLRSKAEFILGSYNNHKFNNATAIFMFLKQETNQKIKPKLLKLKKGTRVISYMHTFKNWKPAKSDKKNKLNLYIVR